MAAAGLCTTLVADYLSSFLHILDYWSVYQPLCFSTVVCLPVCLFLKQGVFMAVLQIAILFGVGSHVVTLYFGQKVKGRSSVGRELETLRLPPPHLWAFFLCSEPSI